MTAAARSKLLTVDEVAERLRVSRRGVYRLAPAIGPTGESGMMFDERDVERYIASRLFGQWEGRHPLAHLLAEEAAIATAELPRCCNAYGFTYFVRHLDLIKIGRSKPGKLEARMAGLQTQSPVPLKLWRLSRGYDLEPRLHEMLKHDRAHGEWFKARSVRELLATLGACIRCSLETTP